MSCIGVSSVIRDSTIASSMIVQDYIAKNFRGEKPISSRYKPKGMDSCFGNFPLQYKRSDNWDGNPTLRRDSRTCYSAPSKPSAKLRRPRAHPVVETSRSRRPKTAPPIRRPRPTIEIQGSALLEEGKSPREVWRSDDKDRSRCASSDEKRQKVARPQTAGPFRSSSTRGASEEHSLHEEDIEVAKKYLLTRGKYRTTPTKLLASAELARSTNRPLSAPACLRRRCIPAPPKAGAWCRRQITATLFRKYYVRGDLPISVHHRSKGSATRWMIRPADLDYHVYLPIFFDGLREVEDPYRFLAVQGTLDMIEGAPEKVLPVIPQLVLPIKTALNTREPRIICPTLKILQQIVLLCPMAGRALVPYYRQLLPVFNLFRGKNYNLGDAIDYNQRSRTNIGELVMETLEVMEQFGGPDAFINIKYMVPTYESCGS